MGKKRKSSTKTAELRAPKRVRATQPEEPEYVEEQRNLQDLWKATFPPIGTEWECLDSVNKYDWDFTNLEQQFEQGGRFHNIGDNHVYLFSATEPSSVANAVLIPILVAVVAPRPPSMEIGIRSVQRESKEIVPMKTMKMDWFPYIPLELREGWNSERALKKKSSLPQIYVLRCIQRMESLKTMKEDRWMKFRYCVPYLMNPKEDEGKQSTEVNILFPMEPNPPLFCTFNWDDDDVEKFSDELVNNEEIGEDKKEEFMEFLRNEVIRAKNERNDRMADPMYQEAKLFYENLKVYKIYPVQTDKTPVMELKSRYINCYYRNAHEIL